MALAPRRGCERRARSRCRRSSSSAAQPRRRQRDRRHRARWRPHPHRHRAQLVRPLATARATVRPARRSRRRPSGEGRWYRRRRRPPRRTRRCSPPSQHDRRWRPPASRRRACESTRGSRRTSSSSSRSNAAERRPTPTRTAKTSRRACSTHAWPLTCHPAWCHDHAARGRCGFCRPREAQRPRARTYRPVSSGRHAWLVTFWGPIETTAIAIADPTARQRSPRNLRHRGHRRVLVIKVVRSPRSRRASWERERA